MMPNIKTGSEMVVDSWIDVTFDKRFRRDITRIIPTACSTGLWGRRQSASGFLHKISKEGSGR